MTTPSSAARTDRRPIDALEFSNQFQRDLPADPIPADDPRARQPRQVMGAAYSRVQPLPATNPTLVGLSHDLARDIGLDTETDTERLRSVLSGSALPVGADPYAMCYGGHQFGNWAGQLGDGRAIAIGEIQSPIGPQTLQLKGAGPTPYSRRADGLAVLRSSVREFLCSEAMYHLGVPTTRALSLCLSGDMVMRDMFYDGNAALEPGAVVCRVAPSFVRFGSFELPASRGELDLLRQLLHHTITHHFPGLDPDTPEGWLAMYREVVDRTADLIIEWQRVGFVHGVMNTDNMSILGLTIDYGPYGWLENYDPLWTPNTTDAAHRRYRFGQQPLIAHWNLVQLGRALSVLFDDADGLQGALDRFPTRFDSGYRTMMRSKLGLGPTAVTPSTVSDDAAPHERPIEDHVQLLLGMAEIDMTLFFRRLADVDLNDSGAARRAPLREAFYPPADLEAPTPPSGVDWREFLVQDRPAWNPPHDTVDALDRFLDRLRDEVAADGVDAEQRHREMQRVNPLYVPRNYLAQLAIDDLEHGKSGRFDALFAALQQPYEEQPGSEHLAVRRPHWARTRAGCSMLSCSS